MSDKYLEKDFERVKKKYEQLMYEGDVESLEKKIESLDENPEPDFIDKIRIKIYNDVLDLKKKKHGEY